MAVTKGHGNPRWTPDETILALYQELGGAIPPKFDDRVAELSETLRTLGLHENGLKRPTFRNPDGVAFKLQNLRAVATGEGLQNVSKVDRLLWQAFGHRPDYVAEIAKTIRARSLTDGSAAVQLPDDEVFAEGRLLTVAHRVRERAPSLRARLLKSRSAKGSLTCDLCSARSLAQDPEYHDAIFEAHHVRPLSELGESKTRLADLALLCASCHRLVHRILTKERRWLSMDELRAVVRGLQQD